MVTAARAHLDGQAQRRQQHSQRQQTTSPATQSPSRRLPAAPGTDAWRERAIELAEARHLTGTVRFLGTDGTGRYETYRVPTSRRDGHYDVCYDRVTEQFDAAAGTVMNGPVVVAHCTASEHRRPCAHVGAVLRSAAFRYFRGELVIDLPDDEWQARLWESEKAVDDLEQGRGATAGRRAMAAGEDDVF